MADTMYAWSDIIVGSNDGQPVMVKCGDTVTKKAVGDSYDQHVESGAIRPYPYPETGAPFISPVEQLRKEMAKSQDEEERLLMGLAAMQVSSNQSPTPDEAQAAAEEAQK